MLTKIILIGMVPNMIFKDGIVTHSGLHHSEIRWVAIRRGNPNGEWCIYYHLSNHDIDFIKRNGDKVFTESIIKQLVPCDDEAFKLYTF
jgi:hypothetical protein